MSRRLGILISGRGSNLQSIIDAIGRGELAAEIAVVISNRPEAAGLLRAREAGLETVCLSQKNFDSSRWFGIPSYYVQRMFAENRGTVVLPAQVESPRL